MGSRLGELVRNKRWRWQCSELALGVRVYLARRLQADEAVWVRPDASRLRRPTITVQDNHTRDAEDRGAAFDHKVQIDHEVVNVELERAMEHAGRAARR